VPNNHILSCKDELKISRLGSNSAKSSVSMFSCGGECFAVTPLFEGGVGVNVSSITADKCGDVTVTQHRSIKATEAEQNFTFQLNAQFVLRLR
jgi:hypothetical protein